MTHVAPVRQLLAQDGIALVPDIYSVSELAEINAAMNPMLKQRSNEKRAYVRPDDMVSLGIFDTVMSSAMLNVIFSIMPDPVIYHLHAYEIAGQNNRPHIFEDKPGGWHRDSDSLYFSGEPTHVSIFVYLSNVDTTGGPFEFCPRSPDTSLRTDSPVISMTGSSGLSFIWHRSFYHRAAPNAGTKRRRLIKISIQRNEFPSGHLHQDFFQRMLAEVPRGEPKMDVLLGRYQGKESPHLFPRQTVVGYPLLPSASVNLAPNLLAKLIAPPKPTPFELANYD